MLCDIRPYGGHLVSLVSLCGIATQRALEKPNFLTLDASRLLKDSIRWIGKDPEASNENNVASTRPPKISTNPNWMFDETPLLLTGTVTSTPTGVIPCIEGKLIGVT